MKGDYILVVSVCWQAAGSVQIMHDQPITDKDSLSLPPRPRLHRHHLQDPKIAVGRLTQNLDSKKKRTFFKGLKIKELFSKNPEIICALFSYLPKK